MQTNTRLAPAKSRKDEIRMEDLPIVRTANPVIALCCSDVHAWSVAPKARSEEKDWIRVWCGYLNQVYSIAEKNNAIVIIAGDLFDKFDPTPEVINAFLDEILSPTYTVAGNHDLEHHRQDNLHKSGYQTLESAGAIKNLSPQIPI